MTHVEGYDTSRKGQVQRLRFQSLTYHPFSLLFSASPVASPPLLHSGNLSPRVQKTDAQILRTWPLVPAPYILDQTVGAGGREKMLPGGCSGSLLSVLVLLACAIGRSAAQANLRFNVSLRFKTDSGRMTTLQLVREGVKRTNYQIDKKLSRRFAQLGHISSSSESIIIRWEAQHDAEVKYSFAVYSDTRKIHSSTVGGNSSGFIPKNRKCLGMQLSCLTGLNEAERTTTNIFILITFSNSRNQPLPGGHILLKLKRSCGPGQCPPPVSIPNGRVLAGEIERCRPGTLVYKCNPGYRQVGCESAVCENGRWSCPHPTCLYDWATLWRQGGGGGRPPCGQGTICQPMDNKFDTYSDACSRITTPGSLERLEHVLCAADYVLIVSLPLFYESGDERKVMDVAKLRIVDEPVFPMRNKSQPTTARSFVYFDSNTQFCPNIISQLRYEQDWPTNRKFLVVGQRSRKLNSHVVIGMQDNREPRHGLLLIYKELERYFAEVLRRNLINTSALGANTVTDFASYLNALTC